MPNDQIDSPHEFIMKCIADCLARPHMIEMRQEIEAAINEQFRCNRRVIRLEVQREFGSGEISSLQHHFGKSSWQVTFHPKRWFRKVAYFQIEPSTGGCY